MQINLDPEHLRGLMAAWRAATDIQIPMDERLKVHFMTRRGEMLVHFNVTAAAWLMLLNGCSVAAAQRPGLDSLVDEVRLFKTWADEGVQALQRMGLQELITDEEKHMPDDPQLADALRKMLQSPMRPPRAA